MVLAGLGFSVVGWLLLRGDDGTPARAPGVVVDLVLRVPRVAGGDSSGVWCPVVSWQPPGGGPSVFEGSSGRNPPAHRVGEQVAVAYDPGGQAAPRVAGDAHALGLVLLVLGSGLLAISLVLLGGRLT